jgi:hypothetical protein
MDPLANQLLLAEIGRPAQRLLAIVSGACESVDVPMRTA